MIQKVLHKISKLQKDARLMELVRGSGLVMLFRVLGALFGYAFIILVSRWTGASGFGIFELAFTAIMIITVLSRLGLEGALVKYVSEYLVNDELGKIRRVYARSARTVLAVSCVLGLTFVIFARPIAGLFDGQGLVSAFRWVGAFTPIMALLQLNAEALRGMRRMQDFSILQNGTIMIMASLVFWLMTQNGHFSGLAAVQAFCVAIAALLVWSYWLLFRSYRDDLDRAKPREIDFRSVFVTALPMMVSGSLFLVVSWTDTLMVGYFSGDAQVGIYRFAFKMAALITFAQFAINSIAAPMISAFSAGRDHGGMRRIIHQISLLNLGMSVPVFVVLVFFPAWVLETAAGGEFLMGTSSLRLLALGQLVNALCGPVMYILNMTGHERDSQRIMIICAILNVILNLVFIPLYGIWGAALATTTSMILWNVMAGWKVYRYFHIITLPMPGKWRKQ